jgi:hypothetical protein
MLRSVKRYKARTVPVWLFKVGLAMAIIVFVALGLMTFILLREVTLTTRIYGSDILPSGGQANYRIAAFNPQRSNFYRAIQVKIWLEDRDQRHLLFDDKSDAEVIDANLAIPAWPPGKHYRLRFYIYCSDGSEQITLPVELRTLTNIPPKYVSQSGYHVWYFQSNQPNSPYRVQLFSENRAPVADLLNWIWLHIQKRPPIPTLDHSSTQAQTTDKTTDLHQASPTTSSAVPTREIPITSRPTEREQATIQPSTQPIKRETPTSQPVHQNITNPVPSVNSEKSATRSSADPPVTQPSIRGGAEDTPLPQQRDIEKNITITSVASSFDHPMWQIPNRNLRLNVTHGRSKSDLLLTNKMGLVRFPYAPQLFDEKWAVEILNGQTSHKFTQTIKPDGYQLVLFLPQVIIPKAKTLAMRIDTLQSKGSLHIDLTQHGQRIWSYSSNIHKTRSNVNFKLPPKLEGLIGVQVYTEFYFPGEIYDTHLAYIGNPTREQIHSALHKHLLERGDPLLLKDLRDFMKQIPADLPTSQWIKPLFAMLKARFVAPTLYYNSASDRLKNLRGFQHQFRQYTMFLLSGLGGLFLLLIFYWLWQGHRQKQRDIEQSGLEEAKQLKMRGTPMLILFFFILLAIFASIILLFWVMKWTYDFI